MEIVKRKSGRPSDYRPELIDKVYEYVEQAKKGKQLPKRCGLRIYLGYCKNTVLKWERRHKDFALALEYLDDVQEGMLVDGGLNKSLSAPITQLILFNHGYKIRKDETSDDKPLPPQIIVFKDKANDNTK